MVIIGAGLAALVRLIGGVVAIGGDSDEPDEASDASGDDGGAGGDVFVAPDGTVEIPTDLIGTTVDCDCFNTSAPNIANTAVEQCPLRERQVMEFAILGELVLTVEDGIITGPLERLCDSVTAGPAGWPYEGLSAEPPDRAGPAPPACVEPIDPGARCVPDL